MPIPPKALVRVLAALAAALALLYACAQSGVVRDRKTGRPLEGVVLIQSFEGSLPMPVESHTRCFAVDTARSDSAGRYRMPALSLHMGEGRIVGAYKRGYHQAPDPSPEDVILMEPHAPEKSLRLEQILDERLPWTCPDTDLRALLPVLRGLYEEAVEAAQGEHDQARADGILSGMEGLTLGSEQASTRAEARRLERVRNPRPPHFTAVRLDPAKLDPYVGSYRLKWKDTRIAFHREEERFFLDTPDGESTEILPSSETEFFTPRETYWMTFIRGRDGEVTGVRLASVEASEELQRLPLGN